MAKCYVCEKAKSFGNHRSITRSHTSRRAGREFNANLRAVKINENGENKKIHICAKCLRSGKVARA